MTKNLFGGLKVVTEHGYVTSDQDKVFVSDKKMRVIQDQHLEFS
jgi:hypothetical protein